MKTILPYAVLLPIGMVEPDDAVLYEPPLATMDWLMTPGRGRWSGRVLSREDGDGVRHHWLYNFERADVAMLFTLLFYPAPIRHQVLKPVTADPDNPPLADDAVLVPARPHILKRIAEHRARWHLRQAAVEQARVDALERVIQEDLAEARSRPAALDIISEVD